jgi:four helix bundle protein
MRNDKPNIIVDLTFEFSLKIIEFSELLESKRKFNLANQLFRSGTSIGANVYYYVKRQNLIEIQVCC